MALWCHVTSCFWVDIGLGNGLLHVVHLSHDLNQCWLIVNQTPKDKINWNCHQYIKISRIEKRYLENGWDFVQASVGCDFMGPCYIQSWKLAITTFLLSDCIQLLPSTWLITPFIYSLGLGDANMHQWTGVIIGSGNGLSPACCQADSWTSVD